MKLESIAIHCLSVPFVEGFQHAAKDRRVSDSIIVEVRALGECGYGEALPREYVSGENTDSVVGHLTRRVWPEIRTRDLDFGDVDTLLDDVSKLLDDEALGFHTAAHEARLLSHNSARCGLELALLDCALKARRLSLAELLPPKRAEATYSGVISTGDVERATALARKMRLGGLTQVKVKVGDALDVERVAAVRQVLGSECSVRVDANGAWDLVTAREKLQALAAFGIESCEEPLGRERIGDLPQLVTDSKIPILVDESLVTEADAQSLLATHGCHGFNLRLSKLGGIGPCLRLAQRAAAAGVWCQLGSHVGETSILAAAGRHVALHLPELRFVEGSFGSLLLSQDVASPSIKFGHGGRAGALRGAGLGAHVIPERIRDYSVRSLELV